MEAQKKSSWVNFAEEHSPFTIAIYAIFIFILLIFVYIYCADADSLKEDLKFLYLGGTLAIVGAILFYLRNRKKRKDRMIATNKHD